MMRSLVCLAGLALLVASCAGKSSEQEQTDPKLVKVYTISSSFSGRISPYPGKVRAGEEATLSFRIAGPIARIHAKEGQLVRKGQMLAEMEARDYAVQLSATEAEYKKVSGEVERIKQLHASQSVSDNDYEKAVYGLQQLSAKLTAHRNALADTRLVAPFDGYIQKPLRERGEMVGAGMPVLTLRSAGDLEVEVNIPASEYQNREHFASFDCSFDIFPDTTFSLQLISIENGANLNQLYRMRLRLDSNVGDKKPTVGMSTMVRIHHHSGEEGSAVRFPVSALFDKEGRPHVWVASGSPLAVSSRPVEVVELGGDGMVVVKGAEQGEQIVVAGVHTLAEGQVVRPIPEATATNVGGLL